MKNTYIKFIIFLAVIFSVKSALAQSLPVGTPLLEDYYRRMQLMGQFDSTESFASRPLFAGKKTKTSNIFDPDSTLKRDAWVSMPPVSFAHGAGAFQILPVTIQQQFNSAHPYGWNDGLMIPAKGYQTMLSAGFFAKIGPLSIQFRPEFVYAANPAFTSFASVHTGQDIFNYYNFYHNQIDQPERFGNGPYNKASIGQSSIRLTVGPISAGISNENLWWGPSIRNSLILSNNAAGFEHITLNTVRPIHTFIGAFEGQIIGGRLNGTGQPNLMVPAGDYQLPPRRNDWRYWTGINLIYQPKWVPGMFLGFTRTFDAYHNDLKTTSDYLPFLLAYQKSSLNNGLGEPINRDQQTSFYSRWVFPKAHAEVYFEYGLNDNSYNFRDFIGSPEHSRAYILGVRKLIPILSRPGESILFSTEITQLSQSVDRILREAQGWYIHSVVTEGQTNLGQILGAGTGSGGNLHSMDVSWVKGLKKFGISFERYEHDVDFAEAAFPPINGNSRKWVDLAFGLTGEYTYKNLLFNAKIQEIKSLNYQWVLKDYNPADSYYIPHNDAYNLHAELGVTFRF